MLNIKGDIWINIWGGYPDIPNMSSTQEITTVLVLRFVKDCIHEGQIAKSIKPTLGHNYVHVCTKSELHL
jgi:hypothetical protein